MKAFIIELYWFLFFLNTHPNIIMKMIGVILTSASFILAGAAAGWIISGVAGTLHAMFRIFH